MNRLGAMAGGLGVLAGTTELLIGTNPWLGDKEEPTTLGAVTIGLAVAIATGTAIAGRASAPATRVAATGVVVVAGLVGFTTAGVAGIPASVLGLAAAVLAGRDAAAEADIGSVVRAHWCGGLVAVLSLVYLLFGVVAGGVIGLLGVGGFLAVEAALALRSRSTRAAMVLLALGVVPFAAATWWTGVIPLTAVLLLGLGLPHLRSPVPLSGQVGVEGHEAVVHADR
jgi:hypothetical protein